jgi:hypothetical protein
MSEVNMGQKTEQFSKLIFSEKSDVWAFGVTCWEVVTRATIPYPTVEPMQILKYLDEGKRMEKPTHCPSKLYNIMMTAWEEKAEDRLTFAEIRPHLGEILTPQKPTEKQRQRHSEPNPKKNPRKDHTIERSRTEANKEKTQNKYVPSPFSTHDRNNRKLNPVPKERSHR